MQETSNPRIDFSIPKNEFTSKILYKSPYLFKNSLNNAEISWEKISEIYERADASNKSFKLMYGYEVPKKEYLESYFNVGKLEFRYSKPVIYDYMRKGATLVYNRIRNEPFVSDLARQVAQYANAQVITSAYAAFGAKPSYRCHWDTRDVFAIQLKGRKRWVLKKPNFELPLYMQQTKDIPNITEPEDVYWDLVLEAGDVLYVPRGWWHNPIPLDGETFHLAIGTFAPTGFDYLNWLVRLAPTIPDGRRNLHSYEASQKSLERFSQEFAELMSSQDAFESFMTDYISQQRMDSKISLGVLGNSKIQQLEKSHQVRLNANLIYRFSGDFMIVNGNRLNVDASGKKLITYLHDFHFCSVDDIISRFPDYPDNKIQEVLFQFALNDVIELVGKDGKSLPKTKDEKRTKISLDA